MVDYQVDEIQQKKREKIGLVVFVIAILSIFCAVFLYLTAGHSFDLTAQDIDSNVGQLDGYFTLVFDGNNTPIQKKDELTDKILRKASNFLGIQDVQQKSSNANSQGEVCTEKATINNVSRFYREKSSTVTSIKPDAYDSYTQGEIIERNAWKIGIVSIPQSIIDEAVATNGKNSNLDFIQKRINKLRYVDEAALILILTPNQKILDYLDKVDCAICLNTNDEVPENGKQCGSVFVMRIPSSDLIATITSSPAKMLIGRTYKEVETP